jgi:DNA-binding transcriptional ArsR family regulator
MYKGITKEQKDSSKILKALGHPVRFYLLEKILKNKICVCALANELDMSVPSISKHFSVLKNAGIVEEEREGNNIYYRIKFTSIAELLNSVRKINKCINRVH